MDVRLFIKPYCGWCHRAIQWLDANGIGYQIVDVTADPAAFQEMRRISGQTLAPVIQVGDAVLADFGPADLAQFWKRLEQKEDAAP